MKQLTTAGSTNRALLLPAVLGVAMSLVLVGCGESSSRDDFDDIGDRDDIVIDDTDDRDDRDDQDDTTGPGTNPTVARYTKGKAVPQRILDPALLTRKDLYLSHLKPQLSSKDVQYNIQNRLAFDTKLFFPKFCLYRDVPLRKIKDRTYRYDTGINSNCQPSGDDIVRYQEWEKGEIEVPSDQIPKSGQTLSDYWFEIIERINDGDEVRLGHSYQRTLLMDYRENPDLVLRKSQLTTVSTTSDWPCRYKFNGGFSGQELTSCVRQTGVRVWDTESKSNGINDFVLLYNPDDLVAENSFSRQKWFDVGSAFKLEVNSWRGTLTFDQEASKDIAPLASLSGPKGASLEFRPTSPSGLALFIGPVKAQSAGERSFAAALKQSED